MGKSIPCPTLVFSTNGVTVQRLFYKTSDMAKEPMKREKNKGHSKVIDFKVLYSNPIATQCQNNYNIILVCTGFPTTLSLPL